MGKVLSLSCAVHCQAVHVYMHERGEGIAESLYYNWSKDFMEAGKKRLSGDTARQATSSEVTDLKREAHDLKEVVAEQTLELRLLKKSMLGDGEDPE